MNKFKIVLKDRTIYSGRAVVRNVVDAGLSIVCEATLDEAHWREVDRVGQRRAAGGSRRNSGRFLPNGKNSTRCCRNTKSSPPTCKPSWPTCESGWTRPRWVFVRCPPGSRRQLEQEVTNEFAQVVIPPVNELFKKFEVIAETIEADQRPAHESYLRQHLHSLVLCAPFAHRTFYKPLGYAGDYEMVNMIARDGQEGGSLYAQVVNCWFLKQPPAAAHRNRLTYLARCMETEALRLSRLGRKARVFNFACGPAVEVQRFLGDSLLSEQVELTLADFNRETLEHVEKAIQDVKERCHRQTAVRFQKQTVHQLLKESLKPAEAGNGVKREYDFVYCWGFLIICPITPARN